MLQFVFVSIDSVSGIIFLWFRCKLSKNFLFYWPVNTNKPNFASFLVFVGAAASFTATISSFETVAKREAILNPVSKQWMFKDIPNYGSQSERAKISIHCLIWWKLKLSISLIKVSFLKYISWFHKGSFHFSKLELDSAQKFWFWFRNWTCFFISQMGFGFSTEISSLSNKVFLLIS